MPIPVILGLSKVVGVTLAAKGSTKIQSIRKDIRELENRHKKNVERLSKCKNDAELSINKLESLEKEIVSSFIEFSDIIEKIQNRPEFKDYTKDRITIPVIDADLLKNQWKGRNIVLGGATAVSILAFFSPVGGFFLNYLGFNLSSKSEEVLKEVNKVEDKINFLCEYLEDIEMVSQKYTSSLYRVREKYKELMGYINYVVNYSKKIDWNEFSEEEKLATQNLVLIVGLLYKMCKVSLVEKSDDDKELNKINHKEINNSIDESSYIISNL